MGVYPKPVLDRMEASARRLVQTVGGSSAQQASTLGGGR
jgi:hypothetical protein